MPRLPFRPVRSLLAWCGLIAGILLMMPSTRGQAPPDLLKKGVVLGERQLFADMRNGTKKVLDADPKVTEEHRKALTSTAQYMVYRLAVAPYNGDPEEGVTKEKEVSPTEDRPITKLMNEVRGTMLIPNKLKGPGDEQMGFINEYGKALEKELVYLIKNSSKPLVRVNAARMLAQTAQMPYAGLADSFVAILKSDNELDAVKMYACEGLAELLSHNDRVEAKRSLIINPVKQAEIVAALTAYVNRSVPEAATDPEVARVVQFTRREGVRALANLRDVAVRTPDRKLLATPGVTLLKIAMADPTMVPPPSLSEQVDALVGFCNMRIDPDMDVGAAVRGVHVAVLDLVRKQNPDPDFPGRERSLPWKIAGARLAVAMTRWKTLAEDIPVAQEPKLIYDYTRMATDAVFSKFEAEGMTSRPDAPTLNEWRTKLEPKGRLLIKTDPNSRLEPVGEPPATPPKK